MSVGLRFFLVLALAAPMAAHGDSARARALTQQGLDEFRELGADMPFGSILYGREKDVREYYKSGTALLTSALSTWESDLPASRKQIKAAVNLYRRAGLLIPFYAIDKESRDAVVDRYLNAENKLFEAAALLASGTTVPTGGTFSYGGYVWRAGGTANQATALAACRGIQDAGGTNWRLPSVRELAASFRAIKDPQRNASFGAAASAYREVWTTDPGPDPAQAYYLDFNSERTNTAPPSRVFQTVCVADEKA